MESIQQQLVLKIIDLYNNALVKKVDVDNFVDIHLPDVNEKKGTHLFFNTSGGKIKFGFYCRDNVFVDNAINSSGQLEKYSQGLRLLGNPQFNSIDEAVNNSKIFIDVLVNKGLVEIDVFENKKGFPSIKLKIKKDDAGNVDDELNTQINQYLLKWQCPTESYNGALGIEGRIPSWIHDINNDNCCPIFSTTEIETINNKILSDKIIPVLSYAPPEFYAETKQVWWIVPLIIWAGDKASWVFIDKNGIYAAHPSDEDVAMVFSWDNLEGVEYFNQAFDTKESEIHTLNLVASNGELTFVEFVSPGRGSYLSVIKSLYEIRKITIEASKGTSQWFEGKGGEGYKIFDSPKDLLDSSKWENPNRPEPSQFGLIDSINEITSAENYIKLGKEKYFDNDIHSAIEDFNRAIDLDSNLYEPYYFRGIINNSLKKFNEAIEDFNRVIEIDFNYKWAYFHRGNALSELNDFISAIEDFNKALLLDSDLKEAYQNRGNANSKLKDFKGAIDDFSKVIDLDSKYFWAYQNRGIAKGELKDFSGAIDDYSAALNINSNYLWTFQNRANSKFELKDYEGALRDYTKVIEIDSNYLWAYHKRGESKSKLADFQSAIEDYSKVIAIDSNYKWAFQSRGIAKSKLNDFEGAVLDFDKVIQIDPNYLWAYQNRGEAKSKLNDIEGGVLDFDKVIQIDPNYKWAYEEKGNLLFNNNDYESAFECYCKILELNPDYCYDRIISYNLGVIYHLKGNYQEAGRLYDIFSDLSMSQKNLGFFYNQILLERGIEPLHLVENELLQKGNKDVLVSALITRGKIEHYNSNGEYDEEFSLTDLSKAIEVDPSSYLAYFLRAKIYLNDYYASYSKDKGIKDIENCLNINRYLPALIKYSSLITEYDLKIKLIKEAITIDSENSLAWQNYGDYLFEGNETESALNAFIKSNDVESDGNILQRIAKCYKVLNKHDEAIDYYTKAIYECEWMDRWMYELAQIYFDQNKLDLAESIIYRAIESYAIEEYYQFLFKILEKIYDSPTHNVLLSDINEYFVDTNLYEFPSYDEKQSDIDFLKSYESKIVVDEDSIFSTLKFFKEDVISYFLENGEYLTRLHILRNNNLKLTQEQLDQIISTSSFSILEASISNPRFENSALKTIVDSDNGTYDYAYRLLGALSNPNISQDIISSLSSNKFNWVLRKTYSLLSDYKNADLTNKYVILGLLDNPKVSVLDKEHLEKLLVNLKANIYSLKFNTQKVSLEEYVYAELQNEEILDELVASIESDEYNSWGEYCANKWHEFGDSEYGMIDDKISISINYKSQFETEYLPEEFFDLSLPNQNNAEMELDTNGTFNKNIAPGTFVHEASSSEVGEYAFADFKLEWEFRPENVFVEKTDIRALITGFEYISKKENEHNYVEGNLVNSRSKGTSISLYLTTKDDLENVSSYDEIKEGILSKGLQLSSRNIKLYFEEFISMVNKNKKTKIMQTIFLKEEFKDLFSEKFLNKTTIENEFIYIDVEDSSLNISYNLDENDIYDSIFDNDDEIAFSEIISELEEKLPLLKDYFVEDFEIIYFKYDSEYNSTIWKFENATLLTNTGWIGDFCAECDDIDDEDERDNARSEFVDENAAELKDGCPTEELLKEMRKGLSNI
jgi:tetratricopeptide (TPR) repeat protein